MNRRQWTLRLQFWTILGTTVFGVFAMHVGEAAAACFGPRIPGRLDAAGRRTVTANVGTAPRLAVTGEHGASSGSGPVVGLWRSVFTANPGTADEFVFDEAFQQFHADGTDLMVSRGVPPDLGNVCVGVWARVADGVIRLRHVTWNWSGQAIFGSGDPFADAFSNANTGTFELLVTLRVNSPGTRLTGTWTAVSFDVNGAPVPGSERSGVIEGERIEVH